MMLLVLLGFFVLRLFSWLYFLCAMHSLKYTRDGNQIVRKSKLVIRNSAERSTQMKCNTCLSCQIASFAFVCYFMHFVPLFIPEAFWLAKSLKVSIMKCIFRFEYSIWIRFSFSFKSWVEWKKLYGKQIIKKYLIKNTSSLKLVVIFARSLSVWKAFHFSGKLNPVYTLLNG